MLQEYKSKLEDIFGSLLDIKEIAKEDNDLNTVKKIEKLEDKFHSDRLLIHP